MKKSLRKLRRKITDILAKDSDCAWDLHQKLVKIMNDVGCINSDYQNTIATQIMQNVFQYDVTGLKSYYDELGCIKLSPLGAKILPFDQDTECLPDNFEKGFIYSRYDDRHGGFKYIYVTDVNNDIISGIVSDQPIENPHDPNHTSVRFIRGIELKFGDYQKLPSDIQPETPTQTDTPAIIRFELEILYIRRDDVQLGGPLFVYVRKIDNCNNVIYAIVGYGSITSTPMLFTDEVDIKFADYRKATPSEIRSTKIIMIPDNFEPGFTYKRNDNATNGPAFIHVTRVDNDHGIVYGITSKCLLDNPHNPTLHSTTFLNGADIRFGDYQKVVMDDQHNNTSGQQNPIQFEPGILYCRRDETEEGPLFIYIRNVDNNRNIIDATIGYIPITSTPVTIINEVDIKFADYRKVTIDDILKHQFVNPSDNLLSIKNL